MHVRTVCVLECSGTIGQTGHRADIDSIGLVEATDDDVPAGYLTDRREP